MAAFVVGIIEVTDQDQYAEYTKRSPAVIARYGGRFLARGGETVAIEGPEVTERVVVLEFPTLEQAVACFSSPDYDEARQFRLGAAEMRLIGVDSY